VQRLLGLHPGGRVRRLGLVLVALLLEVGDEPLERVLAAVEGILLALVAIWSLWRARVRPGWFMPAVAAALVVGTLVSLANTSIT